jgi:hypothetical protein
MARAGATVDGIVGVARADSFKLCWNHQVFLERVQSLVGWF